MAPSYSFPILSNHDIIACMRELDVELTEQALLKPHPDTLYRAYMDLVCVLCGTSREEMYTPNLEVAERVFDYPELYEEAIGNLVFHRKLFELMETCGVPDFGLRDMMKPEYARTRRNLSALINFAKFREEKLAEWEEEMADVIEADARHEAALKRNAELKAMIKEIQDAQKADEESGVDVSELLKEVEALREEEETKRIEFEALEKRAADAEAAIAAAKKEEDEAKAALLEAEMEQTRLEEEIKEAKKSEGGGGEGAEAAALREQVEREKAELAEAEKNLEKIREETRLKNEMAEEVQKINDEMQELVKMQEEIAEDEQKTKEAKAKLKDMEEEKYKVELRIETLKRQAANHDEKMERLKKQGELKKQAAEASLKAAKEELEAVKARRAADEAKSAEEENQIAQLRRKTSQLKEDHVAEIDALLRNFASLRDQVSAYHASLADEMGIAPETRVPLANVNGDTTYNWTNYDITLGLGKARAAAAGEEPGDDDSAETEN